MQWLVRLYDRRIVNVNVNIIVAGVLALLITVGVMHLADRVGLLATLQGRVGDFEFTRFGRTFQVHGNKLVISGMTFLVDVVADVLVYYILHWVANHMPRRLPRAVPRPKLTFMRDATLVQFERALISPLLYIVALGTQNMLLHRGWTVEAATAIGLGLGILVARSLHTLWMLRQERRAGRPSAADIVGPDVMDSKGRRIGSSDGRGGKASA